ncbi:MAG: oligosaccharide flippase family protein, partial [Bacteroidales bacterium]|nr:oligosaccharide flippase family protein [Bacteroidales bacterium]
MSFNKSSRSVNASKNAISAILNKFCILCLTFISRKFFIDIIGVEYLGIHGLFANILTLLSMADLGLGSAMNVSLYKPIANNDSKKTAALLNYYKKVYYYIALVIAIIGLSLTPFLHHIITLETPIPYIHLYYIVFLSNTVISYLFVYKSSIIKADQKNYLVNRVDVVMNIVRVVLKIISILTLGSFLVYILLDVVGTLFHNLVVSHIANKQYPFINAKEPLSVEDRKAVFSNISSIFIYKIATSFLNGTENIIISMFVGTVYVGFYSNYYTITHNIIIFVALLFNALTPSIGNLIATSGAKKNYAVFKTMQMLSFWMSGFFSIGLLLLTQDFIQLWIGQKYQLDNITLLAIVLNTFFSICMRPIWAFREGTGMYRQIKYIMLFTAVLNLVLSILGAKNFGLSGIIFASVISKFSTYFWYEPNILFKSFFNKKVFSYYLDYFFNFLLMLFVTW